MPLGYRLTESSRDRVGRTIGENIRRFKRRMETITNGKKRKQFRSETWINITINPEEIEQSPNWYGVNLWASQIMLNNNQNLFLVASYCFCLFWECAKVFGRQI